MNKTINELKLYKVLPKYIDALRDESNNGDSSVYMVGNGKDDRPFIGIITVCNEYTYFIPLTTYKDRFKYLTAKEPDFTPIYMNGKLVAGIEFNKMIPVPLNQVRPLDIEIHNHDGIALKKKKILRKYEYTWCNSHKDEIIQKAQKLYTMYLTKDSAYKNIAYCVDFPSLEAICRKYAYEHPARNTTK